ncbi:MAG TPA: hypothetical protein VFT81_04345, partial [Dermatophilaceae bacterium]|nr:hypothetical protein [Dermatophilaceae bacterium]
MTDKSSETSRAPTVALAVGRDRAYAVGPGLREAWPRAELPARFGEATRRLAPRWVVWSARRALREVVTAGVAVSRTWDLAEVHRLIHGGWWASPGHVVAGCGGLPESDVPQPPPAHRAGFDGDLFEAASAGESTLLSAEGHLRADALTGWATDDDRLEQLCRLAL